ncbi:MAG TPA: glutamyl-tRNA reductase [Chthoniobacterales bacterium]|jgi:glutamyl-tRNA reductase|nr:glutamyl-tRNA reductase [Chthoniobacterales bacterium]
MNVFCVGISHHTASVETRERYAGRVFGEDSRAALGCDEVLVLATCNRVEVYASAGKPIATGDIVRFLEDCELPGTKPVDAFYRHDAEGCARHLFRVVAGLDSMVIGETEILGQVKKAYAAARESGNAGGQLHRLFQRAFRVAKQVRSSTDITRGAVSVGSVAVDLAEKIFGDLEERRVLILGAGETSERTARSLCSRGVNDIRVSNRSPERGKDLADLVGGRSIPFQDWREQCREVDILISSTSADEPLLTPSLLAPMLRDRRDRPLFIIDIAVPRDVAPEVNEMDGVYLYDIDALQSIAARSLATRRQQIAAAETIIAEHVSDITARSGQHPRGESPAAVDPPVLEQRAIRASQ